MAQLAFDTFTPLPSLWQTRDSDLAVMDAILANHGTKQNQPFVLLESAVISVVSSMLSLYFLYKMRDMHQGIHWLKRAADMKNEEAIQLLKERIVVSTAASTEEMSIKGFTM